MSPSGLQGKTVLIEGADSWMGRSLAPAFRSVGAKVLTTSRRPKAGDPDCLLLDLNGKVRDWRPPGPVDVAVLCAGVTSQKQCRDHPARSAEVNVEATVQVAATLVAAGALVVFPSTNLVFDGSVPHPSESAATCPKTEYGRQKEEAERRLLSLDPARVAILRFTKILGPGLDLFEGWLRGLRAGEVLHPFEDLVMAPISLPFAATAILRSAEKRLSGVLHVSADRDLSYAEAARSLAARLGLDARQVQPTTSVSAGVALEAVPRHTALDARKCERELGITAPQPTDALKALLP